MRLRVHELASACDVTVDTVRYYQSRGLLPQPDREGRLAFYGPEHVERIHDIRRMQAEGLSLAVIRRVLEGDIGKSGRDLATAVAQASKSAGDEDFLTLDELAARSGVPSALLEAIEREGVWIGRLVDGDVRYTAADVDLVKVGLRMLEAGLPLSDLLDLARHHDDAMRMIASRAVAMFDEFVRLPIKAAASDENEAAEKLVAAFRDLLPAVTTMVTHHFRRVLLATAEQHIEQVGDAAEVRATRAESRRRLEVS